MRGKRERVNWRGALWLRRQRVRGRRRFIWRFVVLRFAVPVALLATALRALTEPFRWSHFLLHLLANILAAGVLGGYVAGRLLWDLIVARGTNEPERPLRGSHRQSGRKRRAG